MKVPAQYKGREQTYFKHRLLEAYLERMFMIVGQHVSTICYVDCFAGPWEEQNDDLSDTSIAKSLDIIKKCRAGLRRNPGIRFRALFIEQNNKAYRKLESYLESRKDTGIETKPLNGSFHELIPKILDWCSDHRQFVFFFIDPKGWKNAVEIPTLTPLLRRPNSEFLINFMYDFLSRTVPMAKFQDDMENIFGVIPEDQNLSPEEREKYLVSLYRDNLKRILPVTKERPRIACVKVLKPTKDRTLYHLVYLTRHAKGIVEFMEASDKLDLIQKRAREEAKQEARINRSGQMELFSASAQVKDDDVRDLAEIEEYWLDRLTYVPKQYGIEELADMLEDTGWFESDFQKAFTELDKKGLVKNINAKRKRPEKPIHFKDRDSLMRVNP